ncbi:MAG: phosphoribosylglycinamide formyltransferase [Gemmatimonadota bacterium]|nr:MAG: phosphoribosylglycinamide formyltransferase [Gemmatimonadota bacterium]
MSGTPAVAVFASGGGTNLQSLLDTFGSDGSPDPAARIALVVSDRPGIGALERAERAGVATAVVPPKEYESKDAFAAALLAVLDEHGIDLIALAGYLKLVPEAVVQKYRGRIINIHPGPLPTFGGTGMWGHHVHEAVLKAGVAVSGPTIHFVDERFDTGPIIAQWPVPVRDDDTADTLAARVLKYEHRLYPAVLRALARGEIVWLEGQRVRRGPFGGRTAGFRLADEESSLASVQPAWSESGL